MLKEIVEKLSSRDNIEIKKILDKANLDYKDEHWDPGNWDNKWFFKGKDEDKVMNKLVEYADDNGYIYVTSTMKDEEEGGLFKVFGMTKE